MQSSYNVIKNDQVISQGNKEIVTNIDKLVNNDENIRGDNVEEEINNAKVEEIIQRAEALANEIIDAANKQSNEILENSRMEAVNIQKEAYDSGYKDGKQQGHSEAYQNTIPQAKAEAEQIISSANKLLFNAKLEYENYIEQNKKQIIQLAINMSENVLKRELKLPDGLNDIVIEVIENSKNSESFIIKTGEVHLEELKKHTKDWKDNMGLKGEIFLIVDETLGDCNAVVEKSNGKVIIGIEAGMDGIRQALV